MPFIKTECTDELLKEFAAPSALELEKEIGRHPFSQACIVDVSRRAALFTHPFHHSTYPDQAFTLIVDGQLFRVWEIVGNNSGGDRIDVYVSKGAEHFEDGVLMSLVRDAFSVLRGTGECTLPIMVARPLRLIFPRDPEKIIVFLNKFRTLMPPGLEQVAQNFFVPALVRPEELEAFVDYGRKTRWKGLDPKAMDLFREVLVRLENEAK